MGKKIGHIAVLTLCFLLVTCSKYKSKIVVVENLSFFHSLKLNSSFEVELSESQGHQMTIECAEVYIDKISWKIEDSVLTIKNNSKTKFLSPKNNKVKLKISCPSLKLVNANQSCNIRTIEPITSVEFGLIVASKLNMADLEFNNQNVYCWNNFPCGGTLRFRGNTNQLMLWTTAILTVDSKDLYAEDVFVEHSGKNNLFLRASNAIKYSIFGVGNIEVFGNPSSIFVDSISGSGSLIVH